MSIVVCVNVTILRMVHCVCTLYGRIFDMPNSGRRSTEKCWILIFILILKINNSSIFEFFSHPRNWVVHITFKFMNLCYRVRPRGTKIEALKRFIHTRESYSSSLSVSERLYYANFMPHLLPLFTLAYACAVNARLLSPMSFDHAHHLYIMVFRSSFIFHTQYS